MIANDKNIDAYEPGLLTKIIDSLKYGWELLEKLILFIAKLWGLILFAVIVYILYKMRGGFKL